MSKEKEITEVVIKKEFAKKLLIKFKEKRTKCNECSETKMNTSIVFDLFSEVSIFDPTPEKVEFSISKKDIEFLLDKKQEELVENVRSYGLQLKKLINE